MSASGGRLVDYPDSKRRRGVRFRVRSYSQLAPGSGLTVALESETDCSVMHSTGRIAIVPLEDDIAVGISRYTGWTTALAFDVDDALGKGQ